MASSHRNAAKWMFLITKMSIGLLYMAVGLFFLYPPAAFSALEDDQLKRYLGIIVLLYGIFRIFRAVQSFRQDKEEN